MLLDDSIFQSVIESTPLVSIDLVVCNNQGDILVGRRLNRPARGYWFVPGGRVLKNERLNSAFSRLCTQELGLTLDRDRAKLLGIYEHFYSDSVYGARPDTHYVAIGYSIELSKFHIPSLPVDQHDHYRWIAPNIMKNDQSVHEYSRAYIKAL